MRWGVFFLLVHNILKFMETSAKIPTPGREPFDTGGTEGLPGMITNSFCPPVLFLQICGHVR
jgi:hypothetical protein